MAKVCYLTVQWLEDARNTADNLLIAKIMYDLGKPLDENLNFYVKNSSNDSSLFIEALKKLFTVEVKEEEELLQILIANEEINEWMTITNDFRDTPMYEALLMVNKGLEASFKGSSTYFDGSSSLFFRENGVLLNIRGTSYYMLYHEILESILSFLDDLRKQLQVWREYYGNKRNTNHAS